MELLTTIFGSIFSGGATGLLGVIIQRWADFKNRQLDLQLEKERRETEIAKRKADAEIMAAEWNGRMKVAETEADAAKEVSASQAFSQTLFKEPERYSGGTFTAGQQWVLVILDALRGSVRPLLTIYLCALTTFVWYQVKLKLEVEELDSGAAMAVWQLVVQNILYLTTTVVLWWFGTRNRQQAPKIG